MTEQRSESPRWPLFFAAMAVLSLAALLATTPAPAQQSAAAAEAAPAREAAVPAEKLDERGLPNLGRVNDRLWRGGQPEAKHGAYEKLRALGIDIVVNLRDDDDDAEEERAYVEAAGMEFIAIPWSGFDSPDHKQVAEFLQLVRANPEKRIFVHCRRGAERTGVMVAAWRMAAEGWTPEEALEEMEEFKFRGFWFRNLKRYVNKFPEYWQREAAFAPLRAPAPAAAGSPPQ